jgi:hypothetical protein
MKQELQDQLFKKYPKILFKEEPAQFPIDQRGIECDDGWYSLIDKVCEEVQYLIDRSNDYKLPRWKQFLQFPNPRVIQQVRFVQIKEKFGLLRIYHTPTNNIIYTIINFAENLSASICEICGTSVDVTQNKEGWIRSLCQSCHQKV